MNELDIKYIPSGSFNLFEALCREYDQFYWAVAWAGNPNRFLSEELKEEIREKFCKVVVGIHGGFTSPEFLEYYIDKVKYFEEKRDSIFHPKQYLFLKDNTAALWIGSINFSNAGFKANQEAALLIRGLSDYSIFVEAKKQISLWYSQGHPVTRKVIE
ncbi:phospholipase D family protein, partial [Nostoc sp. NIES-2111]